MSYGLFILCLLGLPIGIIYLIGRLYRRGQKPLAFKILIAFFTLFIPLLLAESFFYLGYNRYSVSNPSFVWTGNWQPTDEQNLPYLRKPNLNWKGIAHGDLAILNFDRDPYAREINYSTDKNGFRNHHALTKADIIVLGDSYTEAVNVEEEDGYVYKLAQKTGLPTMNLGVSGYTTPYESIVLSKYGLPLGPKTVILQIAESNDLIENEQYYHWVKAGNPKGEYLNLEFSRLDSWKMKSPTYRLYQFFFPLTLNPFKLQGTQIDAQDNSWITRFLQLPSAKMRPEGHLGWGIMRGAMMRIAEDCQNQGINLIVIMIPDKINVLRDIVSFDSQTKASMASYPPIPQTESLSYSLQLFCQELGARYIDMTPELRAHAKEGQVVYLPMDTHLSPEGHEVVAKVLAKELMR